MKIHKEEDLIIPFQILLYLVKICSSKFTLCLFIVSNTQ